MTMTVDEIKKQQKYAKRLFWALFGCLFLFVYLVMVFQFGWWGATPANGNLIPAPTTVPTLEPTGVPTEALDESTGVPTAQPDEPAETPATAANEGSSQVLEKNQSPITPASVGSSYLTWLFASWSGVTVFLLSTNAKRYRTIGEDPDTDFIKYLSWYLVNFIRAPLLAMIVLWILTNIEINLGLDGAQGFGAKFSELPAIVLIAIAFILGMYARVNQSQLDLIAQAIFPKAWALAKEGFIIKGPAYVLLKDQCTFRTEPASDVVWTATPGSIDPETGVYKSPESVGDHDKKVFVYAALRSDPTKTSYKEAGLKLFNISGKDVAFFDDPLMLTIETNMHDLLTGDVLKDVEWSSSGGGVVSPTTGKETRFTAPAPTDGSFIGDTVKVTARVTVGNNTCVSEKVIKITPEKDV